MKQSVAHTDSSVTFVSECQKEFVKFVLNADWVTKERAISLNLSRSIPDAYSKHMKPG